MTRRSSVAVSGERRSSAQTSRLKIAISRSGEVATTDAVRRPAAITAISPKISPAPSVRSLTPFFVTSAVPLSIA